MRKFWKCRGIVVIVGLMACAARPDVPAPDQILATLEKSHPRLIAGKGDFERLRGQYKTDATFRVTADKLIARADEIVGQPASKYEIPDGKRLLSVSRRVWDRTETLAVAFHLTQDKRYVDRAWAELDAAGQFEDWNPSHFLDTAEMTNAFAVGYDWLFHQWTDAQRARLREAIVKHGLNEGLDAYKRGAWWTKATHNWNQVCNGGLMMGALAIAEDEPEIAGRIVHEAVKRYPAALVHFGPDGAWNEGPSYWLYAMRYTARPLAGLRTALGTDFGLSDDPGLAKAGNFALHILSPIDQSFNFADGGAGRMGTPDLWWLADRYYVPVWRSFQKRYALARPTALDLVWGKFDVPDAFPETTPLDFHFRGTEVATFRTRWNDPNALFVGLKSGDNKANHSNLDLGSFILDALGERFIVDLGADNYNLRGYFGKERWTYYRLRAEGHNALVIGPSEAPDQDPKAAVAITRFESNANAGFAITDLTKAYPNAARALRGIKLDRHARPVVILQDEVEARDTTDIWWFAHTRAAIVLSDDDRSATLTLNGKSVRARLLEPVDARFSVRDAIPLPTSPMPEGQNANENVRKLTVHLPGVKSTRIVVRLGVDEPATHEVKPLAEW